MSSPTVKIVFTVLVIFISHIECQSRPRTYAILQDTRNEPTPDGNFGYLYQTEDGIVSSARGDPTGKIQGTFSYTDPTGLKVNINYNAGSRFDSRKNAQAAPAAPATRYTAAAAAPAAPAPQARYRDEPQYYSEPEYVEQYRPRSRARYQDAGEVYQQRRGRPVPRENDVYDDYSYRG